MMDFRNIKKCSESHQNCALELRQVVPDFKFHEIGDFEIRDPKSKFQKLLKSISDRSENLLSLKSDEVESIEHPFVWIRLETKNPVRYLVLGGFGPSKRTFLSSKQTENEPILQLSMHSGTAMCNILRRFHYPEAGMRVGTHPKPIQEHSGHVGGASRTGF